MYVNTAKPVAPDTIKVENIKLRPSYTMKDKSSIGPKNTSMLLIIMLFLSLKYPPIASTASNKPAIT
jgi:hypothetical protein